MPNWSLLLVVVCSLCCCCCCYKCQQRHLKSVWHCRWSRLCFCEGNHLNILLSNLIRRSSRSCTTKLAYTTDSNTAYQSTDLRTNGRTDRPSLVLSILIFIRSWVLLSHHSHPEEAMRASGYWPIIARSSSYINIFLSSVLSNIITYDSFNSLLNYLKVKLISLRRSYVAMAKRR